MGRDGIYDAPALAAASVGGNSYVNVFYSDGTSRGPIGVAGTNPFGPSIAVGDVVGGPGRELLVSVGPTTSIFDGISLGLVAQVNPYADYLGNVYIGAA